MLDQQPYIVVSELCPGGPAWHVTSVEGNFIKRINVPLLGFGLSVFPFVCLEDLAIGPSRFSETHHGGTSPLGDVGNRARFFRKNLFRSKTMTQKWGFGTFLWNRVIRCGWNYCKIKMPVSFCMNYIPGKILIHMSLAKILSSNQIAQFFNHRYH